MRGILFTGGYGPDMALAERFLGSADFVIAADSGLVIAEKSGIVPDLIVGDMDSLGDASILSRYPQERIEIWPQDKDYTDTELALAALAKRGIDEVILVGGAGGRIDHFLALRALFDRQHCPSLWLGDTSIVAAVGSGTPSSAIRISGLSDADPVSVFAAGVGPHLASGSGFHWSVDRLAWENGEFSLSNRAETGSVDLTARSGRFFLVVPLTNAIAVERL